MWKLRIEDDQSNRTVVSLVRKQYTIGRSEDNAVRLTERNVSRHHALIERAGEGWVLKDLDSYNGCTVDDQVVRREAALSHNSRLRIGDYSLLLYDSALGEELESKPSAATLPAPSNESGAQPRLVIVEGPNAGTEYPLSERRLLIGRGEECDIALNDTSVSRVHADIELDAGGRYRISDQQSSNGVRVNGVDVQTTTLYSGDLIELGDVHLQFVPRGQKFTRSDHPRAVLAAIEGGFWSRMSRAQRWATLGVGAAAVGTAIAWGFSPAAVVEPTASRGSAAAQALDNARLHLQKGDTEAAHAALQVIAKDSNLRNSKTFRQVEAAWADHQLALAEKAEDLVTRKAILGTVARTPSVDAARRREALDRLARLSDANLEPTDLPRVEDDAGVAPAPRVDEVDVDEVRPVSGASSSAPGSQSKPKAKPSVPRAAPVVSEELEVEPPDEQLGARTWTTPANAPRTANDESPAEGQFPPPQAPSPAPMVVPARPAYSAVPEPVTVEGPSVSSSSP
jgi:pSer/pThr/pTyr-binding forkhead associated (FHA) protein